MSGSSFINVERYSFRRVYNVGEVRLSVSRRGAENSSPAIWSTRKGICRVPRRFAAEKLRECRAFGPHVAGAI
jgi:hypothetical protein